MSEILNQEVWTSYLTKVAEAKAYSDSLIQLHYLSKSFHGESFLKAEEWLKKLLVPDGSLSALTKTFLGAMVNLEDYWLYVNQDLSPDVEIYVYTYDVSDSSSTTIGNLRLFSKLAGVLIDLVADKLKVRPSTYQATPTHEDVLKDPESLRILIEKLLNSCVQLSVSSNKLAQEVFSLRRITRRCAKDWYKELSEEIESLSHPLSALGVRELFIPKIVEEVKRREYTLIGYPDYAYDFWVDVHGREHRREVHVANIADPVLCAQDISRNKRCYECLEGYLDTRMSCIREVQTIGGTLCKMNDAIWSIFRYASKHLKSVPDIGRMWLERCRERASPTPYYVCYGNTYFSVAKGIVRALGRLESNRVEEKRIDLLSFFDEIIPLVALGLYELVLGRTDPYTKDNQPLLLVARR